MEPHDRKILYRGKVAAGWRTLEVLVVASDRGQLSLVIEEAGWTGRAARRRLLQVPAEHAPALLRGLRAAAAHLGPSPPANRPAGETAYEVEAIRRDYPRAYRRWTAGEDARLRHRFLEGFGLEEIASELQRQPSAIRARLEKHKLLPPQHPPGV